MTIHARHGRLWQLEQAARASEGGDARRRQGALSQPNGDRWLLIRETLSDRVLVRHEPNRPSGGKASVVEVGDFLSSGHGPEQQALLRLIVSLVEAT